MVVYNENETRIIDHFKAFKPRSDLRTKKYEQYLSAIPQEHKKYKCHTCYSILNNSDLIDGKCPCGEQTLQNMCPIDHNGCGDEMSESIEFCPICGEGVCPACGDHNVLQISRITGYLQSVSGFNNAKKAELKDRIRVNLDNNNELVRVV